MSKELEALYRLATRNSGNHRSIEEVDKDFKIIEKALKDYESIDNANPSEALECLERIDNTLCLNNIKGKLDFGIDTEEHTDCDSVIGMTEYLETIKQALIKAQEPKHYLKWEDLDFKEKEQTMKVIFNGKEYILKYEKLKDYDVDRVRILDEFFYKYMMFHTSTKQFFNDLRLERVEE